MDMMNYLYDILLTGQVRLALMWQSLTQVSIIEYLLSFRQPPFLFGDLLLQFFNCFSIQV